MHWMKIGDFPPSIWLSSEINFPLKNLMDGFSMESQVLVKPEQ